ncbi:hypothetical protein L6V77_10630 [Myxococcota bacterium]|nr:hypothetical protein [Myxococcota bacterium]
MTLTRSPTRRRSGQALRCAWLLVLLLLSGTASAETFYGTNAPGGFTDFSFDVDVETTQVRLTVPGDERFASRLLVRRGAQIVQDADAQIVTDNAYGDTVLDLDRPTLQAGRWYVRVRTPDVGLDHVFVLYVDRGTRPESRNSPVDTIGSVLPGQERVVRLTVPDGADGLRVVVAGDRPARLMMTYDHPTQGPPVGQATGTGNVTTGFIDPETLQDGKYVYVHISAADGVSALNYRFLVENKYARELTWDEGVTDAGTAAVDQPDEVGGTYLYRVSTRESRYGAWRTVLGVAAGEADLFMTNNSPDFGGLGHYRSGQVGPDAVLLATHAFSANQAWYLRVVATPGSRFRLVSGDVYVRELAPVAPDDTGSSEDVTIGPEGVAFFRTSVPDGTLAWRLRSTGDRPMGVHRAQVPLFNEWERERYSGDGQMLLVPPYLEAAQYLVAVYGPRGGVTRLESRQQTIRRPPGGDPFRFSFEGTDDAGFGYVTYRIDVPVDQIAWESRLAALQGNTDLYVRQGAVPNEADNDAYSEAPNLIGESVTLVPPTLTNGVWYVTVRGRGALRYRLTSGNPVVTPIGYRSSTLNDAPNRARSGWRYYVVNDIESQVGFLGWELELLNAVPGSELAIRRNGVPSRWNYRTNNVPAVGVSAMDLSTTLGLLQQPGHPADIWYVGIYTPDQALGAFTLESRTISSTDVAFNDGVVVVPGVTHRQQSWRFFKVMVPQTAAGWDLRLTDLTGRSPEVVVRRDELPEYVGANCSNFPHWYHSWPSGCALTAIGADLSEASAEADGLEAGRFATIPMNRPLEAGTYYVGVHATEATGYTMTSRGIGEGRAPDGTDWWYPIRPLPVDGVASATLDPRDQVFYRVDVPDGAPGWTLTLGASTGESRLWVSPVAVPGQFTSDLPWGRAQQGDDFFYLYPGGARTDALDAGRYVVAVVGQGAGGGGARIGGGPSEFTLTSQARIVVTDRSDTPVTPQAPVRFPVADQPVGSERTFRFRVADGLGRLEVELTGVSGDVVPALGHGDGRVFPYARWGGPGLGGCCTLPQGPDGVHRVELPSGEYTLTVGAVSDGGDGRGIVEYAVEARGTLFEEERLDFNGGDRTVRGQSSDAWRYFQVEVPPDAIGWDLQLLHEGGGIPQMVIRRATKPVDANAPWWNFGFFGTAPWEDDWQSPTWAASFSGRSRMAGSESEFGRRFTAAVGPTDLTPGTYWIGVVGTLGAAPMDYRLLARGIGEGRDALGRPWHLPVTALVPGRPARGVLPPSEIAVYSVDVPPGVPAWGLGLETLAGESMFTVARGRVPSVFGAVGVGTEQVQGLSLRQPGGEFFYRYPNAHEADGTPPEFVPAGRSYVVVTAEGRDPASGASFGEGPSSFELTLTSPEPVRSAPAPLAAGAPVAWRGETLRPGEQRTYRFDVAPGLAQMNVQLRNPTGDPHFAITNHGNEERRPWLGDYSPCCSGGNVRSEGGVGRERASVLRSWTEPNGRFTVVVAASAMPQAPATYDLVIEAAGEDTLTFNGGETRVQAQPPATWRFFTVDVPPEALGWHVTLDQVESGNPTVFIRRDDKPSEVGACADIHRTDPLAASSLPDDCWVGARRGVASDWTARYGYRPDGSYQMETGLTLGMNRPLTPGRYVIGVSNLHSWAAEPEFEPPMTYRLRSDGIGRGADARGEAWTIPIVELPASGQVAGAIEHPRGIAVYHTEVPVGLEGWSMRVEPSLGDVVVGGGYEVVPNVNAGRDAVDAENSAGLRRQKDGAEYVYLHPRAVNPRGPATVMPGDYYFVVASEGQRGASEIGDGPVAFQVTTGAIQISDVRDTPLRPAGGARHWAGQRLLYGEQAVYRVRVPSDTPAVRARLENSVGNPWMFVLRTPFDREALPSAFSPCDRSGNRCYGPTENGLGWVAAGPDLTTLAPGDGDYTIVVAMGASDRGAQDGLFDLSVEALAPEDLDFDGGSVTKSAVDQQVDLYRVVVPESIDGAPVAGWRLMPSTESGHIRVRVRRAGLPLEYGEQAASSDAELVVSDPVLAAGEWFVEVVSQGLTQYRLTSRPVRADRVWVLPRAGQVANAPGLAAPWFADTGVDANGRAIINPETQDQGRDLAERSLHFYALDVPEANDGLLHVQLEAISGQTYLYARADSAPTSNHNRADPAWYPAYERVLTGRNTLYADWGVSDAANGARLRPGRWWLAVYAPESNARYRLRLSTGDITPLAQAGGQIRGHALSAGNMRFYRVSVPESSTNLAVSTPTEWMFRLTQQSGDVRLFLRADVPPAQSEVGACRDHLCIEDWSADDTYHPERTSFDGPGDWTVHVPPIEPGKNWYVGVLAATDAVYDLDSTVGAQRLRLDGLVAFYGDRVDGQLAPAASRLYRVDVPADAVRWRHTATHSGNVRMTLYQDAPPTDEWPHWASNGVADSHLSQYLRVGGPLGRYPWQPGHRMYLEVKNLGNAVEAFTFVMDGRDDRTDDEDGDALPDWWEWANLGGIVWDENGDADGDGLDNGQEYASGTLPTVTDTDADGLSDGVEVDAGLDPLDPDSDNDGVIDGEDVSPDDATDAGPVLVLRLDRTLGGEYGHGIGSGQHPHRLVLAFDGDGRDRLLRIQPAGVAAAGGLRMTLNGEDRGVIPMASPGAVLWLRAGELRQGENRLVVEPLDDGPQWGARAMGAYSLGTAFGSMPDLFERDTEQSGAFDLWLPRDTGEGLLEVEVYDAEVQGAVTLEGLAGRSIDLPGEQAAWSPVTEVPLPPLEGGDGAAGAPVVRFVRSGGDDQWGVAVRALREFSAPLGTDTEASPDPLDERVAFVFPGQPGPRLADFGIFRAPGVTVEVSVNDSEATMVDVPEWQELLAEVGLPPVVDGYVVFRSLGGAGYWFVRHRGVRPAPLGGDDSDGDGLPDDWELAYFGDLVTADGTTDRDEDGSSDLAEFLSGSNPLCRDRDDDGLSEPTEICADGDDCDDLDPGASARSDDADCDGVPDEGDAFPNDPAEARDNDGDGVGDNGDGDDDGDGVPDELDFAPNDPSEQMDTDGDGLGDNADDDDDGDGVPDDADGCPLVANASDQDLDDDGLPDACDPDRDGDGLSNLIEEAFGLNPDAADSDGDGVADFDEFGEGETPLDSDGDGQPDAIEDDADGDGVPDSTDLCRTIVDAEQRDTDGDGVGDVCDDAPGDAGAADIGPAADEGVDLGTTDGGLDAGDAIVDATEEAESGLDGPSSEPDLRLPDGGQGEADTAEPGTASATGVGCACRADGSAPTGWPWGLALLVLRRRRRRANAR